MNILPLLILFNWSTVQEPKVKRLSDQDQIGILNAIDDFKQYHTNRFKVNFFRRVSTKNKDLNGFQLASYIIGIINYSDTKTPILYEVGDFYGPQVISASRQSGNLKLMVEHGKDDIKKTFTLIVSSDGVQMIE